MPTVTSQPKATLTPQVLTALGITDRFGKDLGLYKLAQKTFRDFYLGRISYHNLKPDWAKIEQTARAARREAKVSLIGLWRLKLQSLATEQIEQAHKETPLKAQRSTTASDVAARMLEALGG